MDKPMSKINLKRLVSQPEVSSLIGEIIKGSDAAITIQAADGTILMGDSDKPLLPQYQVKLGGEVIGLVAGNLASAIASLLSYLASQEQEKKALGKEVLDKYREINLLYALSNKLTACLDVKEISKLVIYEAQRIIKATNIYLLLLTANNQLEIAGYWGEASENEITFIPGRGIVGSVLVSQNAEIVNDAIGDARFIPGKVPISSLICAPLKTQNGAIGAIIISSKQPVNYTAQDLKFATGLASLASAAIENALLHENKLQEARIKSQLERYIPPQLVNAIIATDAEISLAPTRKSIAILFSDIRGFTTKCEELPPETIVGYLNEYFTHMVDVIFSHEGTVNKFVGDMIVAMFGAPAQLMDNEKQAIAAAIAMQMRLRTIPVAWIRENFLTGIGISSGEVVIGNIGSPQHLDYTAIGDEVNLASRLQGIAKGGQILVSRSVYEATQDFFSYREFGSFTVKGKRKSVEVFEVIY
jgi:adenylate cyclase